MYHGGTEIVETPVCKFGRRNRDFGQGFYITGLREQAVSWARQTAKRRGLTPFLNRYRLNREAILSEGRCKVFKAYDREWLAFIVASRRGEPVYDSYDYIEGGVADDRVVDTVNLYMLGLMDKATALQRLSKHQPNNQMCIIMQELADKYPVYDGAERIE